MIHLINDICSPTTVKQLLIFTLLIACNRYNYKLSQMSMFKVDKEKMPYHSDFQISMIGSV